MYTNKNQNAVPMAQKRTLRTAHKYIDHTVMKKNLFYYLIASAIFNNNIHTMTKLCKLAT